MRAWLVVFFSMVALDYVWAEYTRAIVRQSRVAASALAAAIIGLGVVSATEYVQNTSLILPAMLGAFIGTWLSIGRHHK